VTTPRLIRVSSRALGHRSRVRVYVYDTLEELRAAADRFNGTDNSRAAGVTQLYANADDSACLPVVRLCRTHLGSTVVSHEMHHAAAALYGVTTRPEARARAHLTHYNEPFAYLFSDLFASLVAALYRHGYYDTEEAPAHG
jgi:hypothetical protein